MEKYSEINLDDDQRYIEIKSRASKRRGKYDKTFNVMDIFRRGVMDEFKKY